MLELSSDVYLTITIYMSVCKICVGLSMFKTFLLINRTIIQHICFSSQTRVDNEDAFSHHHHSDSTAADGMF